MILIYPGSFNPFHIGHYSVAKNALKCAEEVWVMVSNNPQKTEHGDINFRNHYTNASISLWGHCGGKIIVSNFEQEHNVTYTYQTFELLKEKYPDKEFGLVIGDDQYENIKTWKNWNQLPNIHVHNRYHNQIINNVTQIYGEIEMISSTEIRNDIIKNQMNKATFMEKYLHKLALSSVVFDYYFEHYHGIPKN